MQDDYFNGKSARKGRYSMRCSAVGRRALRFSVGAALWCARNPSLSSSFALFALLHYLHLYLSILFKTTSVGAGVVLRMHLSILLPA